MAADASDTQTSRPFHPAPADTCGQRREAELLRHTPATLGHVGLAPRGPSCEASEPREGGCVGLSPAFEAAAPAARETSVRIFQ